MCDPAGSVIGRNNAIPYRSRFESECKGDAAIAALTVAPLRLPGNPNPSGETLL
jgi:hypothetical protein